MIVVSGTFSITIRAVNHEPVWVSNPPPIVFKSGAPSKHNIVQYVSDSDGDKLEIVVKGVMLDGTIPGLPGVTFDGTDLVFDGRDIGRQNVVGSVVFTADDGREAEPN